MEENGDDILRLIELLKNNSQLCAEVAEVSRDAAASLG